MSRVYLDYNATTPLRPEAKEAMLRAMEAFGNPSSVHAEGRAALGMVEAARAQVAGLVGCLTNQVIFTSGATEAAALAVAQKARHGGTFTALDTEHDCLRDWSEGAVENAGLIALSAANSETGLLAEGPALPGNRPGQAVICDITQAAGKIALIWPDPKPAYAILSAHKLGGPKGVGALINFTADDPVAILRGGGQEMGRRSGTENVIGICGFGAAAEAAQRDVGAGAWGRVEKLRNILETTLEAGASSTILVGKEGVRLPNTSCFFTPRWRGETQVMQMDLAGFAISAGSACASGKVKPSNVLKAMGFSDADAACAVRVSLGLQTTEDDVTRFADRWLAKRQKHLQRAA